MSILQEITALNTGTSTYKIRGNSILQTFNELNGNNRIYPTIIAEYFVECANKKIAKNRMLGEMDHPIIQHPENPNEAKRQLVVHFSESSHMFTKMWLEGNKICGLVETLSNQKGIDLARMANIDKIPIGFSLRSVGKVNVVRRPDGVEIQEVCKPVVFVTYDSVTDPSHKVAELVDITSVITSSGESSKLYQSENNSNIMIDESNSLLELKQMFMGAEREPMQLLIENFLGNTHVDHLNEETQSHFVKSNMVQLIDTFLNSSCNGTKPSTYSNLNESNVQDFMQDYAANRNEPEYNSSKFMRERIKQFLG